MPRFTFYIINLFPFVLVMGIFNAKAQKLSYSGSLQYASGSYYFTQTTYSFYFTNGLTLQKNGYSLSLSVPFVVQNSPWISYTQSGFIPTGGPQHGVVGNGGSGGMGGGMSKGKGRRHIDLPDTASYNRSSFSDPTVSVGIPIVNTSNLNAGTNLKVLGDLKIPFSSPAQGYGTGEWDGGLGMAFTQRLKSWFAMINLMYWWFGDMPDLVLNDALSYGGGIGKSFNSGKWLLLGNINGMTRIIDDTDPPLNIGGSVNYTLSAQSSLMVNISFGLSESSSDILFGGGWLFQLN